MQHINVCSFQFLFNDGTMSNFDTSAYGDIAKYEKYAVKPEDYHKIHRVLVKYDSEFDGSLVAL